MPVIVGRPNFHFQKLGSKMEVRPKQANPNPQNDAFVACSHKTKGQLGLFLATGDSRVWVLMAPALAEVRRNL